MKILKQILILFLVVSATGRFAYAQLHPILGKFSVSEHEGRVFLSWSIVAGSTCNGIQVYRSTDSLNFIQIGEIPGVCGSVNFEQPYSLTDDSPVKNKVNYYRLEFGSQDFSQTISIELIDIANNGFQIRPHPANAETKVYFDNSSQRMYELSVLNFSGQKILSTITKGDYFILDAADLPNGAYLFTISIPGDRASLTGKLLVRH